MAANNNSIALKLSTSGGPQVVGVLRGIATQSNNVTSSLRGMSAANGKVTQTFHALGSAGQNAGRNISSGMNGAVGSVNSLHAQLKALDTTLGKIKALRLDNIAEAADKMKGVGQNMVLAGGAGIAVGGKTVQDAATVESIKVGLETTLGKAGAKEMFQSIVDFDKRSQFSFEETAKGAQRLIAAGVAAKDVIPTMEAIGNAVAAAGGGTEEFMGVLRAWAQIQTKNKLSQEELNQISEHGIGATRILAREMGLTEEQLQKIGEEGIPAAQALEALRNGFNKDFAGGMDRAAATLKGQFETLKGNVFQFSALVGSDLAPTISMVGGVIGMVVKVATAMPEPLRKIVVGLLAVSAVGVTLGGGLLILTGMAANAVLAITAFTQSEVAAGIAAGRSAIAINGFSAALSTRLIPALGAMGMAMKAMGVVGLGLGAGAVGYHALQSSGALGKDAAPLGEAVTNTFGRIGAFLTTGHSSNYDKRIQGQWAEGRAKEMFAAGREKAMARRATAVNTVSAPSALPGSSAVGAMAGIGGAYNGPSSDSFTSQIRALEDELRGLTGKKNAAARKAKQAELTRLRRAQSDARKAEAASRKEEREQHRLSEIDEAVRSARLDTANAIAQEQVSGMAALAKARNDRALKGELQRIEDAKDAGLLDQKTAERASERLRQAYENRNALEEARNEFKIKQIEAEEQIQRAQIEAENQQGKERELTLKRGLLASQKILEVARVRLGFAQRMVAEAGGVNGASIGSGFSSNASMIGDFARRGGNIFNKGSLAAYGAGALMGGAPAAYGGGAGGAVPYGGTLANNGVMYDGAGNAVGGRRLSPKVNMTDTPDALIISFDDIIYQKNGNQGRAITTGDLQRRKR